jgi:hypothetical protein
MMLGCWIVMWTHPTWLCNTHQPTDFFVGGLCKASYQQSPAPVLRSAPLRVIHLVSVLQDTHSCWHGFDVDAMWKDLNRLAATIAAEREAKRAAAEAEGRPMPPDEH